MRISTQQIYQQGVHAMQTQQRKVQNTEMQIASGLRIMKPSDDPSGAVKVLNLTSNIEAINQFSRNVSVAESALAFEESVVSNLNTNLQRIRELVVQGNNSSNSEEAKNSIAQEIYQRLDELVSLGNTRDAGGEYIFAGFKVGSPPFVEINGAVVYQGDEGQRLLQVGEGSRVAIRDSGRALFQEIPSGNGVFQVEPAATNTGSGVIGEFGLVGSFVPDTYTVSFVQGATGIDAVVTDSANNVISTQAHKDGGSISFAGAQFVLNGVPAVGDKFMVEPSRNRDMFTTVKNIADALVTPAPGKAEKAKYQNEMAIGLASLDQALSKVTTIRAGIGARLNNIETIDGINQDFKLQLETALSDTQDLDFAEAIAQFNLQLTSLQAAQQAFVKTSSLSLFQYL